MSKGVDPIGRRLPSTLIALSPGTLQRSRAGATDAVIGVMERAAHAAISGGVRSLMLREPALEDGAFLELAQRLRAVLDGAWGASGGWLAVHDRLHLAQAAGADAVHLGGTSLGLEAARRVVGDTVVIGASSHAADTPGDFDGADYLLHAPVFAPTSKPLHGRETLGWGGVEAFAAAADVPVIGLGGITAESLRESVRDRPVDGATAALHGVALIGSLWASDAAPIDGMSRALTDTRGIHARAEELTSICSGAFQSPPNAPLGGSLG